MTPHLVRLVLLTSLFYATTQAGFIRASCLADVTSRLENGSISYNDPFFFRDANGTPSSNPDYPTLTLPGCQRLCGKGHSWYPDIGPRLSTWLIPVFLLLSNIEVSPLDKRRYLMILHLLGDPIDSLWALVAKFEAWSRCKRLASKAYEPTELRKIRNLATVLGGFEELIGFHANPLHVYTSIASRSIVKHDRLEHLISRTAVHLADNRTDERLRTILATVLYLWQLVSAFVTTIGDDQSSPPSGRIGTAMFMTWIIPTILLSNAIGGFTSRRTCFDILERFIHDATGHPDLWLQLRDAVPSLSCFRTVDDYFDALSWSGGIYSYRPEKQLAFTTDCKDRNAYILLSLAISPIINASVISSVILWDTAPVALNCRSMLIFGILLCILLSALFTHLTARSGIPGRAHWHMTLFKDALVAIPSVLLVFLSSCGLFNSCWCWSGIIALGFDGAHVPLNTIPLFNENNKTSYPTMVGILLLSQILVFVAMVWTCWDGWLIMRWSEQERVTEWRQVRQGERDREMEPLKPSVSG